MLFLFFLLFRWQQRNNQSPYRLENFPPDHNSPFVVFIVGVYFRTLTGDLFQFEVILFHRFLNTVRRTPFRLKNSIANAVNYSCKLFENIRNRYCAAINGTNWPHSRENKCASITMRGPVWYGTSDLPEELYTLPAAKNATH